DFAVDGLGVADGEVVAVVPGVPHQVGGARQRCAVRVRDRVVGRVGPVLVAVAGVGARGVDRVDVAGVVLVRGAVREGVGVAVVVGDRDDGAVGGGRRGRVHRAVGRGAAVAAGQRVVRAGRVVGAGVGGIEVVGDGVRGRVAAAGQRTTDR